MRGPALSFCTGPCKRRSLLLPSLRATSTRSYKRVRASGGLCEGPVLFSPFLSLPSLCSLRNKRQITQAWRERGVWAPGGVGKRCSKARRPGGLSAVTRQRNPTHRGAQRKSAGVCRPALPTDPTRFVVCAARLGHILAVAISPLGLSAFDKVEQVNSLTFTHGVHLLLPCQKFEYF